MELTGMASFTDEDGRILDVIPTDAHELAFRTSRGLYVRLPRETVEQLVAGALRVWLAREAARQEAEGS